MHHTGFHDGPHVKTLRFDGEFVWDGTNLTLRMWFDGHVLRSVTPRVAIVGASGHFVDVHARDGVAVLHASPSLWDVLMDAYRHRVKGDGSYAIADPNERAQRAERDPDAGGSAPASTPHGRS